MSDTKNYRIFTRGERIRTLKPKNELMVSDYVPAGSTGAFLDIAYESDMVILSLLMDEGFEGPDGRTRVLEFYLEPHEDVSSYIA